MTTLRLTIELTYDENVMHEDDAEGKRWFRDAILKDEGGAGMHLHSNEIGDEVGSVKVLKISRPRKERAK
jgi:hypothetical protein